MGSQARTGRDLDSLIRYARESSPKAHALGTYCREGRGKGTMKEKTNSLASVSVSRDIRKGMRGIRIITTLNE